MSETIHDSLRLENQLCFPLYACSREIIKRYRPYLDTIGLTYTQYVTMMVLWEERSVSVKELGKKLYLDSGTLTPVLKSLEAKGCVTRRRSTEDERVLIASLTEDGAKLMNAAEKIPEQVGQCMQLTTEESLLLYQLLYKLLGTLET